MKTYKLTFSVNDGKVIYFATLIAESKEQAEQAIRDNFPKGTIITFIE